MLNFDEGDEVFTCGTLSKIKPASLTHYLQPNLQNVGIESENTNADNANVPGPRHYMKLREVTDSQRRPEGAEVTETSPYLEINEYAPLHPATRSWEVSRENIVIEKVIGQGAFGQVAKGKASELQGRDGTITVAVKMLKGNTLHCNSMASISRIGCKYRYTGRF